MATDEFAKELGEFRSWMWQSTVSYGVQLSKKSSIGVGFKLFHQRLADSATQVGSSELGATELGVVFDSNLKFNLHINKIQKDGQKLILDSEVPIAKKLRAHLKWEASE